MREIRDIGEREILEKERHMREIRDIGEREMIDIRDI